MSASSPAAVRPAARPIRRPALSSWLREPLFHFLVLGALVFLLDGLVSGGTDESRVIVVDAAVDAEARRLFVQERRREPSAAEIEAMRRVWLDNEVLYREGLEMRVDRGDAAIRDRVIFKALSVIEAGLRLPPIDDDGLRAWFERNRSRYDEPARFDFQEALVPGETSEAALRTLAATLNSGSSGEVRASLNVFKARPHPTIVQSYGEDFARALEGAPAGEWRVLPAKDRPRLMRLDGIVAPRPADFDAIKGLVMQDWTDATMADLRTAAVHALAKKYTLKVAGEARK